jgi:hypothetical protein
MATPSGVGCGRSLRCPAQRCTRLGSPYGAVNQGCTQSLADAFVVKGTAAGLDTSCAAKAPLTPFVLALP